MNVFDDKVLFQNLLRVSEVDSIHILLLLQDMKNSTF